MSSDRTLLVIGSGPGIGRSVTTLFSSKRYNKVALIARRPEQLAVEKSLLEEAAPNVVVKTYALDISDPDALLKALNDSEADLGKPETVFFNAARVVPSQLLAHKTEDMEYDFKINVSALYTVAQRVIPQLIELRKSDPTAKPALLVTSSLLPQHPMPDLFALSLVKAAQRNLVQSLSMTYASEGVHVGLIVVGGVVTPEHKTLNPTNIAAETWKWFNEDKPALEVSILEAA